MYSFCVFSSILCKQIYLDVDLNVLWYKSCGSNNIVVFLTICISYANNCFTL